MSRKYPGCLLGTVPHRIGNRELEFEDVGKRPVCWLVTIPSGIGNRDREIDDGETMPGCWLGTVPDPIGNREMALEVPYYIGTESYCSRCPTAPATESGSSVMSRTQPCICFARFPTESANRETVLEVPYCIGNRDLVFEVPNCSGNR